MTVEEANKHIHKMMGSPKKWAVIDNNEGDKTILSEHFAVSNANFDASYYSDRYGIDIDIELIEANYILSWDTIMPVVEFIKKARHKDHDSYLVCDVIITTSGEESMVTITPSFKDTFGSFVSTDKSLLNALQNVCGHFAKWYNTYMSRSNVWEFVEKHHPNYHSDYLIDYSNTLAAMLEGVDFDYDTAHKAICFYDDDFGVEDSDNSRLVQTAYMEDAQKALDYINGLIYKKAIENYENS